MMKVTADRCQLLEDSLDDESVDFLEYDDRVIFEVPTLPASVMRILQLVNYYIED
jgi:hypothetical protein